MQEVSRVNETLRQSIKLEHYLLHCASSWQIAPLRRHIRLALLVLNNSSTIT